MSSSPSSVPDLLRIAAAEAPETTAVTGEGREITYGLLSERSDRVADLLSALPVGSRVGYVNRNATEYFELLFGAAKAGVALVPLNFRLSADEMRWILDDAGVSLVVAGPEHEKTLSGLDVPLIITGEPYEEWLSGGRPVDPRREVSGDDLLVLMYSSGTTGRPKGVQSCSGRAST
jgi:acyl-CoA synthetase (AMP-forming)/AMP-acid ligase II